LEYLKRFQFKMFF